VIVDDIAASDVVAIAAVAAELDAGFRLRRVLHTWEDVRAALK
jgi:hypothetical protein